MAPAVFFGFEVLLHPLEMAAGFSAGFCRRVAAFEG
jgi:hypothetical protein